MKKVLFIKIIFLASICFSFTSCNNKEDIVSNSTSLIKDVRVCNQEAFWNSFDSINAIYCNKETNECAKLTRLELKPVITGEMTTFKMNNFVGGKIADQLGKVAGGWCGKWAGGALGSLTGNPAITVLGVWGGRRIGQVTGAILCSYLAQKYLCTKHNISARIISLNLNSGNIYVDNDSMGIIHNKILCTLTKQDAKYSLPNNQIDCDLVYKDCIDLLKQQGIYNDTIALDCDYKADLINFCKNSAPWIASCYEGKISGNDVLEKGAETLQNSFNVSDEDIKELKKVCKGTINNNSKKTPQQINNYANDVSSLIQNNHSLNEKEKANISSSLSVGLNSSLYWDCLEKQIKDN